MVKTELAEERKPAMANANRLYLVGPRRLQNELMASMLNARGLARCEFAETLDDLREAFVNGSWGKCLVLLDCPGSVSDGFSRQLCSFASILPSGVVVAVFNVDPEAKLERDVFECGVRGFFYEADGLESFVKGVGALFDGELWMTRKVMSEVLSAQAAGPRTNGVGARTDGLTAREVEVLARLSAGASNEEIAGVLSISAHTVKTHVYRVFRKIKAENRLQAALWAAQNL